MPGVFTYANTDLELAADFDLTPLATEFKAHGWHVLTVQLGPDGVWYANLEIGGLYEAPEATISAMLEIIATLGEQAQRDWAACTKREFDVGYVCGTKPWAFNQGLTCDTLRRIAAAGASLRITLYAPERVD